MYTYYPDRNPELAGLPGVPLRDLTAEEVAALPEWLQASIAACPFYEAVADSSEAPVAEPAPKKR